MFLTHVYSLTHNSVEHIGRSTWHVHHKNINSFLKEIILWCFCLGSSITLNCFFFTASFFLSAPVIPIRKGFGSGKGFQNKRERLNKCRVVLRIAETNSVTIDVTASKRNTPKKCYKNNAKTTELAVESRNVGSPNVIKTFTFRCGSGWRMTKIILNCVDSMIWGSPNRKNWYSKCLLFKLSCLGLAVGARREQLV